MPQRPGRQHSHGATGVFSAAQRQMEWPDTGQCGDGQGGPRSEEAAPSSERALSLPSACVCVCVCPKELVKPQ